MRHAKPWYRRQTDSWYVTLRGVQYFIGRHPDGPLPQKSKKTGIWNAPPAIETAFHEFMSKGKLPTSEVIAVAKVCDLFLQHAKRHNDARTFNWYSSYLQDFCKGYGRLKAVELRPFHVSQWLDSHDAWKASRRHAVIAVKRAFNFADREGILSPSPIRGVCKPASTARSAVLTKDERKELLAAIQDRQFRQFTEAMQESGARPSEIARLTAADVNLGLGVCVLHKHKTAGKTKKPRVIYMTPRFLEIVRPLMLKYTDGPLFRGPRLGKPFGLHGITARFRRLRAKMPHLKNAVAYAFRHGFATDALMNGVGVAQVAELLGHRTTDQVVKHYSHIHEQTDYMLAMARKATGN
jgi:integrase